MSVKKAPAPPDYQAAAAQQTAANRPNQSNAFATSTWGREGVGPPPAKTGDFFRDLQAQAAYETKLKNAPVTQSTTFQGGLGDAATGLLNQAGALSQGIDWTQFGQVGTGDAARQQAIDAAYGQATSRLDPMWAQREEAMRGQLLNQGLDPGSEAYRNAMTELSQQRNDAYQGALNAAIGQGTSAGESAFRSNLMARQQAIGEALQARQRPLQEMAALQGLSQQAGFMPDATLQGALAQGQGQLAAWQAQNQANADIFGGALQGAGSLAMAAALSDERLKDNVVRYDVEAIPGVPFASWTWKGDDSGTHWVGVIAQDLAKVAPEYVHVGGDGMLRVDYSFLEKGKA